MHSVTKAIANQQGSERIKLKRSFTCRMVITTALTKLPKRALT